MTEFFQISITALLIWLGFVFSLPVNAELIPDIKQMKWKDKQKWFWISVIITFYITLVIILICIWILPGFNFSTK